MEIAALKRYVRQVQQIDQASLVMAHLQHRPIGKQCSLSALKRTLAMSDGGAEATANRIASAACRGPTFQGL
jgi:hypothetical protein